MTIYNKIFEYPPINRKTTSEGRKYLTPDGNTVSSVTTILDKTKSEEKKLILQNWRKRVGEKKATEITKEAAGRGTSMHSYIEEWLVSGDMKEKGNLIHQQSYKMASLIVEGYLNPLLSEWWGSEAGLYFPSLYAGATDLTGVYNGVESIIDFKQTNKPKKTEWIEDYFLQVSAYAAAHNEVYGTEIKQGVILMCSKDLELQCWIVNTEEYADKWWDRVEKFYSTQNH